MTFGAVSGTECPACDEEGKPTGKLGPTLNVSCKVEECPVDRYWSNRPPSEFDKGVT